MARKKINTKLAAEVIFKSNRQCCVCNERGDHIHHINGDNSKSDFDNLAFLCYKCHNDATIKNSMSRELSPELVIKYRDLKYKTVAAERETSLKVFNTSINQLTTEDLLVTSRNALLIIELEKIQEKYFAADWDKRSSVINKLEKFAPHTNFRITVDIYNFLTLAADQARGGMPSGVADSISHLAMDFFPYSDDENDHEKIIELSSQCINMAFSMVYDAALYLKNYRMIMIGLTMLKYIYKKGQNQKIPMLIDKVNESYNEIEQTLKRPERKDLKDALALVKIFRKDIKKGSLVYPRVTERLMKLIYGDKYDPGFGTHI